MKFTLDCDCTPEEARAFLGLPDVKPMQEKLLREMEERMSNGIGAMSPDEMMRYWMPNLTGLDQMQAFFSQMTGAKPVPKKKA